MLASSPIAATPTGSEGVAQAGRAYTMVVGQGMFGLRGGDESLSAYQIVLQGGNYAIIGDASMSLSAWLLGLDAGSYAISGSLTMVYSLPAFAESGGTYATAGGSVACVHGYQLVLATGTYSLTDQVLLREARAQPDATGRYALIGGAVLIHRVFTVTAVQGAYAISGAAVQGYPGFSAILAQGRYDVTIKGSASATRSIVPNGGSYALTGGGVVAKAVPIMNAARGTYLFAQPPVPLARGRRAVLVSGSYGIAGRAVAIRQTPIATLDRGSYASIVAGSTRQARVLIAGQGTYAFTGYGQTLKAVLPIIATSKGMYASAGGGVNFVRSWRIAPMGGIYELLGGGLNSSQPLGVALPIGPRWTMTDTITPTMAFDAPLSPEAEPSNGIVVRGGSYIVATRKIGLGRVMQLGQGAYQ